MSYFQGTFEERCLTTGAPTHLSFLTATLSIVFLIINILGNFLVILAVGIDPHKNLRTPFNYLMTNLAVADLIVGTVTDPLSVYFHVKEGLDKKLSLGEIRAFHMSYFISCTSSVLSLAAIAVERYLAICSPHAYRNKLSGKRVLLMLGCIWFVSLTLPFIYLEVGFITYAFIFANTSIIVAVGVTLFTYALLFYKFKQRAGNNGKATTTADHPDSNPQTSAFRDNAVQWEYKVTKKFLVVMVALLCCYGPSTILIYTLSFCENCSCEVLHWFRDLQLLLVLMNSSVNFYCYALRSPRFRNAFSYILRMKRQEQIEPVAELGSRTPTKN